MDRLAGGVAETNAQSPVAQREAVGVVSELGPQVRCIGKVVVGEGVVRVTSSLSVELEATQEVQVAEEEVVVCRVKMPLSAAVTARKGVSALSAGGSKQGGVCRAKMPLSAAMTARKRVGASSAGGSKQGVEGAPGLAETVKKAKKVGEGAGKAVVQQGGLSQWVVAHQAKVDGYESRMMK